MKKQNKANLIGTKYFGESGMPPCPITTITAKTNFKMSIEWFLILVYKSLVLLIHKQYL